jgi:hypothetical protein
MVIQKEDELLFLQYGWEEYKMIVKFSIIVINSLEQQLI